MLLPYWNHAGDVHQLESYPSSFHDWTSGDDLPQDQRALHASVERITGQSIVHTSCRAMDMNLTLDATLDNGTSIIIRQRRSQPSDSAYEKWNLAKFKNEIYLLRWLKENTSLPVPAILAVEEDFTIQEKMPGATIALKWHFLADAAKARFMESYTNSVLQMFRLPVSQRIGSAMPTEHVRSVIEIGPRIGPRPSHSSSEAFNDIGACLSFLLSIKRRAVDGMEISDRDRALKVLKSLTDKISGLLSKINDASLLRCALTHGDLHTYNILVDDEGNITAILDWEINYSQPAVLAVEYPAWLLDIGPFDPRFARKTYWWEVSPQERPQIRQNFEQSVKVKDPDFHRCLIEGRDLRAAVAWLVETSPDPGFDCLRAWLNAELE